MFKIPQIEKENFYIDRAMKSMQDFAQKERDNIENRYKRVVSTIRKSSDENNLNKRKDLELEKIRHLNTKVNESLRKVIKNFPNFLKIDEIYIKLINTSETPVPKMKEALADLKWICDATDDFTQKTEFKIKRARSQETVGFLMKKHLGKVNSLFSKSKKAFINLDDARKFMNKLPEFMDLHTVSIAGFPNVGKSTLMKKISGSDVEIQNYPFTTKGLMFSYLNYKGTKAVQLIDTPGLLGREKNNEIEERAKIVLTEYCNSMVFVLDFTESCGYSVENQIKLLKKLVYSNKPIVLYFSKTDIYNEEDEERKLEAISKIKKFKSFSDSEELKKFIIDDYLSTKKKFDPSKLKVIK